MTCQLAYSRPMSDRWSHFRRLLGEIETPDLDTPEGELLAAFPELLDERDKLFERCGDTRGLWRVLLPPGLELKDVSDDELVRMVLSHVRHLEADLAAARAAQDHPEQPEHRRFRVRRHAAA